MASSNAKHLPTTRFLKAQNHRRGRGTIYSHALDEIIAGRKDEHWIWFIFPQLRGLGRSYMSDYYGIADLAEAQRYLRNKTLRDRLREITRAAICTNLRDNRSAYEIFGSIDEIKVRSCWTLFLAAATTKKDRELFQQALDTFYPNNPSCRKTMELLERT